MKKRLGLAAVLVATLFLAGCITIRIETQLKPDGSGLKSLITAVDSEQWQAGPVTVMPGATPEPTRDMISEMMEDARGKIAGIPGAKVEPYKDPATGREGVKVTVPFGSLDELVALNSTELFDNMDTIEYDQSGSQVTLRILVNTRQVGSEVSEPAGPATTPSPEELAIQRQMLAEMNIEFKYVIEAPGQIVAYEPRDIAIAEGNRVVWDLAPALLEGKTVSLMIQYDVGKPPAAPVTEAPPTAPPVIEALPTPTPTSKPPTASVTEPPSAVTPQPWQDSDGDGVVDVAEVYLGTDPSDAYDAPERERDSDGDGVMDVVEVYLGTNPGDAYDTPKHEQDSDGDGVVDVVEIYLGTNPGDAYDTPKHEQDSDGDGVVDVVEVYLGTDPGDSGDIPNLEQDSDGDGVPDPIELEMGTDPTDRYDTPETGVQPTPIPTSSPTKPSPPPSEFPWGRVIIGGIIVVIVGGIAWFFRPEVTKWLPRPLERVPKRGYPELDKLIQIEELLGEGYPDLDKLIQIEELPVEVPEEFEKEKADLPLDVLLHLKWVSNPQAKKKKLQWITWIGDIIDETPDLDKPNFPASNLRLEFEIRDRFKDPKLAGLDLETIKLTADFPFHELKPGTNQYDRKFIKRRDEPPHKHKFLNMESDNENLVKGWFMLDEPLKPGKHTITLAATDNAGHSKTIVLVFTTTVLDLALQVGMPKKDIPVGEKKVQVIGLRDGKLLKTAEPSPVFPESGLRLNFEIRETAVPPESARLDVKSLKLIPSFPCCGFGSGANLLEPEFRQRLKPWLKITVENDQLVKGWLDISEAGKYVQYEFTLTAADESGNQGECHLEYVTGPPEPLAIVDHQNEPHKLLWTVSKPGEALSKEEHKPYRFKVQAQAPFDEHGKPQETATVDLICEGANLEELWRDRTVELRAGRNPYVLYSEEFVVYDKDSEEHKGREYPKRAIPAKAGSKIRAMRHWRDRLQTAECPVRVPTIKFMDKDNIELEAIPLVWRKWEDYSPFYFRVVVEDPSIPDKTSGITTDLVTEEQKISGLTLSREKEGIPRFSSAPVLAWAKDEFIPEGKQGLPDREATLNNPGQREPIVWIQARPMGTITANDRDLRVSLPTPDRRAVILVPALGYPGLVHQNRKLEVALMMRSELKSPTEDDVAGALGWRPWKNRDKGEVAPVRVDKVVKVDDWWDILSQKVSWSVDQRYQLLDFGTCVIARVQAPAETGMYALIARFDESNLLRKALSGLWKPECPTMDNTKTLGFQGGKAGRLVGAYHPVAVYEERKKFLNIAHLSDTHIAARWEILEKRWNGETSSWFDSHHPQDLWRRSVTFRFPYYPRRVWYCGARECKGHSSPAHNCRSDIGLHVWKCSNPACPGHSSYEHRCTEDDTPHAVKPGEFNNPNSQTRRTLDAINGLIDPKDIEPTMDLDEIDILIITGDLIDYNRGLKWKDQKASEGDLREDYYWNLNWLCFYEMLLDTYQKPVFTVLGNHDWRLNPYAPLSSFGVEIYNISPDVNLTRAEMDYLHENAHAVEKVAHVLDLPYGVLYTTPRAVDWYSLVINPCLDYTVGFGRMIFAMLDWSGGEEDTTIDAPDIPLVFGTRIPHGLRWRSRLPWAKEMLDWRQWVLLRLMEKRKDKSTIPIICLHAPIFNPFPEMGDNQVNTTTRGRARLYPIEGDENFYEREHDAVHGTIMKHRTDFIDLTIRMGGLVLSGHTHRSGVYEVVNDKVKVREPSDFYGKSPLKQTVFAVIGSSGLINFRNKHGGEQYRQLMSPVCRLIAFDERTGNIKKLNERTVKPVYIRGEARSDFGEYATVKVPAGGRRFEIWTHADDFEYYWTVKNTSTKSDTFITAVRIKTDVPYHDEVWTWKRDTHTSVPEGWDVNVVCHRTDGTTVLEFRAQERRHAIHPVMGEKTQSPTAQKFFVRFINLSSIGQSVVKKYGELSTAWGEKGTWTDPAIVPVPGLR